MVTTEELFALSKAYPIISIIIAAILFYVGLRVATKLIRWIFWILAIISVVAAVYMLFVV